MKSFPIVLALLSCAAFSAQGQIVPAPVSDTSHSLSIPVSISPESRERIIARPVRVVQLGAYIGLTTIRDNNQSQYLGKNTLPLGGITLRFGNPERSKALVFATAEAYRYKVTELYDSMNGNTLKVVRGFQATAGVHFPIQLDHGNSLYLAPGFTLGEAQGRNLDYYKFYWGVSLGVGYEKRMMTNLRFFAEMTYNANQTTFRHRKDNIAPNLDTFRLKCGLRF